VPDWLGLVEAWALLFFYHLASRWMSYERLSIQAHPAMDKRSDPSQALILAKRIQQLVAYAARLHLLPMTCLMRSLAIQEMLVERNIPAHLCIGVYKSMAEIHAHAWVEVNGVVLGESRDVSQKFRILGR